jgi:hypothetical protein
VQARGPVSKDPISGEPAVQEHSLRRCILLAADANWATLDYRTVEDTVLEILSEVYRCLEKLNKLRGKYAMDLTFSLPQSSPPPALTPAPTGIQNIDPLFSCSRVAGTLTRNATLCQERSRAVSFFRKVSFCWSVTDDTNDRGGLEDIEGSQ